MLKRIALLRAPLGVLANRKFLRPITLSEISDNVMGRKNFLFCNTQRGAHSSAVIYSMIETAKENALDPFLYLTWLLKRAPYLNLKSTPDIDKLLPENAPSDCYSKKI